MSDEGVDSLVALARGEITASEIDAVRERAIVASASLCVGRRVGRIEAKLLRGSARAARREADELRRSLAGRLDALWRSLPRHLKDRIGEPPASCEERRATRWQVIKFGLSEVGKLDRPSRAGLHAKSKRRDPYGACSPLYRPIFRFEWIDQARQRLIRTSLNPFVDFHPSQRLLRRSPAGRGRSAVLETLLQELPRLGPDHVFVQFDVQDYFSSINHTWLEERLPLPKAIIRSHAHTGGMTIVPTRKNVGARLGGAFLENLDRRGIAPGSALSALVGEYVIADVLRGLADRLDGPLLHAYSHNLHTYSDNIGVFVARARADAIVDILREAFASSAAGPFVLRAAKPVAVNGSFRFLGYWFRVEGGKAEAFVPEDFAEHRMAAILSDVQTADSTQLARIRRTIDGVAADWRHWSGAEGWKADAMNRVGCAEAALDAFDRRDASLLCAA